MRSYTGLSACICSSNSAHCSYSEFATSDILIVTVSSSEFASGVVMLSICYLTKYTWLEVHTLQIPLCLAGETDIKHLSNEQAADDSHFKDKDGNILEVQDKLSMLEWLANNYKKFGCALEFVSNKSQEGSQFCRGFGGIGGLLRYAVDLSEFEAPEDNGEEFWNSDEDI